jgi:hypothetical protein
MSEARIVVTSVVRHGGSEGTSGFVRVVDLARRRTLMKSATLESAYRANDLNPRGGLRGARGIGVHGDRLLIANTEQIMIFDLSWNLVGKISHPLMAGVHEILTEEDGIWVTCASTDLLLKFAWTGELLTDWEWRRDESLRAALGFENLPAVNRALDYRNPDCLRQIVSNIVHLNGVSRGSEGLIVSLGRILSVAEYRKLKLTRFMGVVGKSVGVKPRQQKLSPLPASTIENSSSALVLLQEDGSTKVLKKIMGLRVPNHNVIETEGCLVYNDTNGNRVVRTSIADKGSEMAVTIPGMPAFVRGMAQLSQHQFLVVSQRPAAIYQVDFQTGDLEPACPLYGHPDETVHAICILPARFNDPPARWEL